MTPITGRQARATPLRRADLIARDAMVAALRALSTERLVRMLDWIEEHPRNKECWDSLMIAGGRMIVDLDLLRAELARPSRAEVTEAVQTVGDEGLTRWVTG